MKKYYYISIIFFFSLYQFGQTSEIDTSLTNIRATDQKIDSLLSVIETNAIDTVEVKTILALYRRLNARLTIFPNYYALKALAISEKINYPKGIKNSTLNLVLCFRISNPNKALYFANKYFELASKNNNYREIIYILKLKSQIHLELGEYKESEYQSHKALEIATQHNDSLLAANCLENIASCHQLLKEHRKATEVYEKLISYYKKINDEGTLMRCYYSASFSYIELHEYDRAIEYLKESTALSEKNKQLQQTRHMYSNLGKLYIKKNTDSALKYFSKSEEQMELVLRINYNQQNEGAKTIRELEFITRQKELALKDVLIEKEKEDSKNKSVQRNILIVGFLITFCLLFLVFKIYRQTKKDHKIISEQKKEVESQKHLIEDKQKEILDSIRYARRIQTSLLPTDKYIEKEINKYGPNNNAHKSNT